MGSLPNGPKKSLPSLTSFMVLSKSSALALADSFLLVSASDSSLVSLAASRFSLTKSACFLFASSSLNWNSCCSKGSG